MVGPLSFIRRSSSKSSVDEPKTNQKTPKAPPADRPVAPPPKAPAAVKATLQTKSGDTVNAASTLGRKPRSVRSSPNTTKRAASPPPSRKPVAPPSRGEQSGHLGAKGAGAVGKRTPPVVKGKPHAVNNAPDPKAVGAHFTNGAVPTPPPFKSTLPNPLKVKAPSYPKTASLTGGHKTMQQVKPTLSPPRKPAEAKMTLSKKGSANNLPVKLSGIGEVTIKRGTSTHVGPKRASSIDPGTGIQSFLKTAQTLIREQGSDPAWQAIVSATELKGNRVWCDVAPSVLNDTSSNELFAKCVVVGPELAVQGGPGTRRGVTKESIRLKELNSNAEFTTDQGYIWMGNGATMDPLKVADIGLLPHQTIPCVLDFLRDRYMKGHIYTMVDPLLVAVNPFKDLGNTSMEWIVKYRDDPEPSKLGSHVFTTARAALDNLHSVRVSQSIIVSGESGAGKTEATKQIMRYFGAAKSGYTDARIQTAVLAANPVLEAFGNAKTVRNNNSSRFGRFMQLQVAKDGGIQYGIVKNFLLEKSRILTQDDEDRSYHIFYQLLKGADKELKAKLHLQDEFSYKLINPKSTKVLELDDARDFSDVMESLMRIGLTEDERLSVLSIVSGVLLFGNVNISCIEDAGIPDAAIVDPKSRQTFEKACELLFLEKADIEKGITVKTTYAGNQRIDGRFRKAEGQMLKDSLAKALYDKLFDLIISKLNTSIKPPEEFKVFIGMLDIFGFEVFRNNSLEQLFINITNERLQKNFIDIVFERETKLYRSEGISSAGLVWTDNRAIIELLCNRRHSVLALLEDQCLAPGGTDKGFLGSCLQTMKDREDFKAAVVGNDTNFVILHTIGAIQYCADNFLLKNKDVLRSDMVEVVQASTNSIAGELFEGVEVERGKLAKGQLIGSQFMGQLEEMMLILNKTEPHFIRCVKPNEEKAPLKWDGPKTLIQLHALSILEALQLRNLGYSYRRPFHEFIYQFKYVDLDTSENKNLTDQQKCEKILETAGVPKDEWQMGKTMIFMKQGGTKTLFAFQRRAMARWQRLVWTIEAMYLRKLLRREKAKTTRPFVRLQSHIRKQMVTKELEEDPYMSCPLFPYPMLTMPLAYFQAPNCPYPMPATFYYALAPGYGPSNTFQASVVHVQSGPLLVAQPMFTQEQLKMQYENQQRH